MRVNMINVLCFGDSNTYGYKPDGSGRFDENTRWTGLIKKSLSDNYNIYEEGLCGRTSIFDDERRAGRKGLDLIGVAVETHNPVDILVVMLGTNDCKTAYKADAVRIAEGVESVIEKAESFAQKKLKVLLVSPIHLGLNVGEEGYDTEFDKKSEYVSRNLALEYKKVEDRHGYEFLDASKVARPSTIDREHLDENGHKALASAIQEKILVLSQKCIEYIAS